MPLGVEHILLVDCSLTQFLVFKPLMPLGVEHGDFRKAVTILP